MMPMSDLDHPIWIVASGLVVMAVTAIALYCNYSQWETPKDALTISQVAAAYFITATGKRIARMAQRSRRGKE